MSALQTQIGGDHYRTMKIQPVEFIKANDIGFCEGNAITYLCRWQSKGGVSDLRKAIHHIELLIEFEERSRPSVALPPEIAAMEIWQLPGVCSMTISNLLSRRGIKTVGDVVGWSEEDLLDLKGFGPARLRELAAYLATVGVTLMSSARNTLAAHKVKVTAEPEAADEALRLDPAFQR